MTRNWNDEMKKSQRIYGESEGRERTIARAKQYLCSVTLGRDFGHTVEDHLASNPTIKSEYDDTMKFLECA